MTSDSAAQAAIGAAAHELHLPTVRAEATRLAEIAVRERQSHLGYLAEVLSAEVDDRTDRRRTRRRRMSDILSVGRGPASGVSSCTGALAGAVDGPARHPRRTSRMGPPS
jgi:hypothetical protein